MMYQNHIKPSSSLAATTPTAQEGGGAERWVAMVRNASCFSALGGLDARSCGAHTHRAG